MKGGKSAVLVAITVGLGAKASFTQRGSKITDLIKHNKKYNHTIIPSNDNQHFVFFFFFGLIVNKVQNHLLSLTCFFCHSHATISIKLRNRGPDAFKPDLYGPSIIVERRISRDGGTTWKLKDAHGKLVSNKKSELNLILEQFNIQIDNPCNILMQDKSREFLANSKPKAKYQVLHHFSEFQIF